jgi:GNAT superfamily N-acetyltransferase
MEKIKYNIRGFTRCDRDVVRKISCETSFLEYPREMILDDDEVLADALTLYFTDFEPESCFVAVVDNQVAGYIIGTKDVIKMEQIVNSKIIGKLFMRAIARGVFLKWRNLRFFFYVIKGLIKREFYMPDFSKEFPAALHINIDKRYRRYGIGAKLLETYLLYLRKENIKGIHFGTFSGEAGRFFTRSGFTLLFQSKRSYLKPYIGKEVNFYVFGSKL